MSTIKSSSEHLTLNADGAGKDISLQANGSTKVTVKSDGKVGVGTASPLRQLHVLSGVGTAQIESTGSASTLYLGDSTSSSKDNQGIGSAGNDITLIAGGYERLRIQSGGGISFNGDTATANALDDYEEGTWSMAVIGASGSAGAWAMAGVVARYTKIGRVVHFTATGYLTNLGSYTGTSVIQITGLPFVNDSNINVAASASSIPIGQYNSTNYVPQVQSGQSYLNIRKNQYGDATAIYNEQSINIRYNISGTYNVA